MSTYTAAHKKYYEKNKHVIAERSKETKKKSNREYYQKNKARLDQKRKENDKKARQSNALQKMKSIIYDQTI